MTTVDLRTDKQKERDRKHQAIMQDFIKLRESISDATDARIISFIAKRYSMTNEGIRLLLKRKGLTITPARQKKK